MSRVAAAQTLASMTRLAAAQTLRSWALDEELKASVMNRPALAAEARRIAARYVAGEDVAAALRHVHGARERGHSASVEYAGESVRDLAEAHAATDVFVSLAAEIGRAGAASSTVSGDLSHIGLLVSATAAKGNAVSIVEACRAAGVDFMISAEGSDRTDSVLDLYEWLAERYDNVGITVQARLHRSESDLDRLLALPGRIRLVKGAFLEPEATALARESPLLPGRYESLAARIADNGHELTLATHDDELLTRVLPRTGGASELEIETLMGLDGGLLGRRRAEGLATREYCIFGDEWWLYVLNRLAEDPERVLRALADLSRD